MKSILPLLIAGTVVFGLLSFRNGTKKTTLLAPAVVGWPADTLKTDAETGLINDKNFPLIKANCTGCHSPKLILQHRFTREGWVGKIRWMQSKHNLWDLGESEKVVLDYLEKYHSPNSSPNNPHTRRAPLKNIKWFPL